MVHPTSNRVERRRIIERPRLLRLLDETDARIILLLGPAGYGKTTLARQWLSQRSQAVWFPVTDASNDIVAFATSLLAASRQAGARVGDRLERRLAATHAAEPSVTEVIGLLASDLGDVPGTLLVALDDYHVIKDIDADRLAPQLIDMAPIRLLVTARRRPTWAKGRRRVYGEILEIDASDLRFSRTEASTVLGRRQDDLHSLARGWPAVIGLAAHARRVPTRVELPEALFDYFADEMYRTAPPLLKEALLVASTSPKISIEFFSHFFGDSAGELAGHGIAEGFFIEEPPTGIGLHPLVRTFLRSKLESVAAERALTLADRSVRFLLAEREWDAAFWTIERFARWTLVAPLIDAALDELLSQGRLKTLDRWLAEAAAHNAHSPVVDLARAEVAFRRADQARARLFARRATDMFRASHGRYSQAWFRRGQIAHFSADYDAAMRAYAEAERTTDSLPLRRNALWGLFTVVAESSGDAPPHYLESYEDAGEMTIDDELRLANAKLILAHQEGGVIQATRSGQALLPLIERADDPLVQSSFLNGLAHGLRLAGAYEAGHGVASRELEHAEELHLAFVLPHGLVTKAGCEIGLRRFAEAEETLGVAEGHLARNPDRFAEANCRTGRIRLLLARSALVDAEREARRSLGSPSGTAVDDELVGLAAFVFAVRGHTDEAQRILSTRPRVRNVEIQAAIMWGRVAAYGVEDPHAIAAALEETLRLGAVDSFVTAYRTVPRLLPALATGSSEYATAVDEILARAGDQSLIAMAIRSFESTSALSRLSKREREVLDLLSEGLSNREIARMLFISDVTVKVHVRHILDKLGARSRTEAAVIAARNPTAS